MTPESIPSILEKIAKLLAEHREPSWARACRSLAAGHGSDPDETKRQIRSMFGGMGSFNDLVLHGEDGAPLPDQNIEFDDLRTNLHNLCR